jgi:hypothetical protein
VFILYRLVLVGEKGCSWEENMFLMVFLRFKMIKEKNPHCELRKTSVLHTIVRNMNITRYVLKGFYVNFTKL